MAGVCRELTMAGVGRERVLLCVTTRFKYVTVQVYTCITLIFVNPLTFI